MNHVGKGPERHLNALDEAAAHAALSRCCGSSRWVKQVLALRPFAAAEDLFMAAERVWQSLGAEDYLEAFSHHPEIGADLAELGRRFPNTAALSAGEQQGVERAGIDTLHSLRDLNATYKQRFGFIFIVCASGKSAAEMLTLLEARLGNSVAMELAVAAAEQAKITRLRLQRLGT